MPASVLAEVEAEIRTQALALTRVAIVRQSIALSIIVKCASMEEAMGFSNEYAPEHLILQVENAASYTKDVKHAGSVFVGAYSPESCVHVLSPS
jgi:phosphoribosyl-ATP pyrophosphohydrolase/phosphoribosyl-AMP cyclohydrolase/histidinol dehydrogenase